MMRTDKELAAAKKQLSKLQELDAAQLAELKKKGLTEKQAKESSLAAIMPQRSAKLGIMKQYLITSVMAVSISVNAAVVEAMEPFGVRDFRAKQQVLGVKYPWQVLRPYADCYPVPNACDEGLDLMVDGAGVFAGGEKLVGSGEDITEAVIKKLALRGICTAFRRQ